MWLAGSCPSGGSSSSKSTLGFLPAFIIPQKPGQKSGGIRGLGWETEMCCRCLGEFRGGLLRAGVSCILAELVATRDLPHLPPMGCSHLGSERFIVQAGVWDALL